MRSPAKTSRVQAVALTQRHQRSPRVDAEQITKALRAEHHALAPRLRVQRRARCAQDREIRRQALSKRANMSVRMPHKRAQAPLRVSVDQTWLLYGFEWLCAGL